jgi:hypothetical protein
MNEFTDTLCMGGELTSIVIFVLYVCCGATGGSVTRFPLKVRHDVLCVLTIAAFL